VFNTAELLINQVGLTPGVDQNGKGLFIKLNSFVEAVQNVPFDWYEVKTTNTITGEQLSFYSPKVIIAAGSTESPKLIHRSTVYQNLPDKIRKQVGFGLTDHPVTGESQAYVSSLGRNASLIPLSRQDHAKIIFYSRGNRDANGQVIYPFNIEMNVNHEYWHLRNNDPSAEPVLTILAEPVLTSSLALETVSMMRMAFSPTLTITIRPKSASNVFQIWMICWVLVSRPLQAGIKAKMSFSLYLIKQEIAFLPSSTT